jgi:hypothetical protein
MGYPIDTLSGECLEAAPAIRPGLNLEVLAGWTVLKVEGPISGTAETAAIERRINLFINPEIGIVGGVGHCAEALTRNLR